VIARGRALGPIGALATVAMLLAGCADLFSAPAGVARPCGEAFVVQRCEAILVAAADLLQVDPATVATVTILPDPPTKEGVIGGGRTTNVRLTFADGRSRDTSFGCPGVSAAYRPECMPEPHLVLSDLIEGGYRDTPEGATPMPEIDPEAMAQAVPLLVPRLELPIDAAGPQRIRLGEVALANGIVQEATFGVEGAWPAGLVLRGGSVRMELVGVGETEPIWNIYEHGWVEGTERVEVFLVFDVGLVRPGARLVVLDVRVR
jgi:hypothetical protein